MQRRKRTITNHKEFTNMKIMENKRIKSKNEINKVKQIEKKHLDRHTQKYVYVIIIELRL